MDMFSLLTLFNEQMSSWYLTAQQFGPQCHNVLDAIIIKHYITNLSINNNIANIKSLV